MEKLPDEESRAVSTTLPRPRTPVVGVGASAGGLEALSSFFDAMPADSGSAFVVVIHLDPEQQSHMAEILATHTAMTVIEVTDGVKVAANSVYVIAPNTYLRLNGDTLNFAPQPKARSRRHPIDDFFESLAVQERERAVGVVLSGTGTNGTYGLKAIKAEGGLALVQDPATAKFAGMPTSAIAAGVADRVSAPEAMPLQILQYLEHEYVASSGLLESEVPADDSQIDQVIDLLRRPNGHDFRRYKPSTLRRRIYRRMGLLNKAALEDYVALLREDVSEVEALIKDLLITVTDFFRDREAWEELSALVIHRLVRDRDDGSPLRIWVPACATGEEAYSIAMLVSDAVHAAGRHFDIKVFATDAQEDNLRRARDGIYPEAALSKLSAEQVRQYFERLDGGYRARRTLRDLIVFAAQDLLTDPPFSRLDLVSCRNLLIYLEPDTQQRLIALFHFALREGGYLFLGGAETIGRQQELFTTISKKWRIYGRLGPTRHDIVHFPLNREGVARQVAVNWPSAADRETTAADVARQALLARHTPVSVLADSEGRVLYFHGSTGLFLENPTGKPTRDLFALVKGDLSSRLRVALGDALSENRPVKISGLVRIGPVEQPILVVMTPLDAASTLGRTVLVSFVPQFFAQAAVSAGDGAGDAAPDKSLEVTALRDELVATRSELESTIHHLGNTVEALRISNQEVTSMNEELQSTNEELETSKEELQSFNEELHTINSQLERKVTDLENTSNDLNNLLVGTEVATLFLDMNLAVKWFSPGLTRLVKLLQADIGRPIMDFARKFGDDAFQRDAEWVIENLGHREAEVPGEAGRWYMRRMMPYRTQDNRIAGVVVTFTDITDRKRAGDAINEARLYAETIVETVSQPLLVLDQAFEIQSANPAFYKLFKSRPEGTIGRSLFSVGDGQWDVPALRNALRKFLPENRVIKGVKIEGTFEGIGSRTMLMNISRLARNGGRELLILLAINDITLS